MKTIFTLLCIAFPFLVFSQTLLKDDFSTFLVNADLNSQDFWTNNSSETGGGGSCTGILCTNLKVVSKNLSYTNFGAVTQAVNFSPDKDAPGKGFAATTSGSVYVSLLLNISDASTSGGDVFRLAAGNNFVTASRIQVKKVSGGFNIGIDKYNTAVAFSNNIYAFNTDYLIVLKYTFNTASQTDDKTSLYINPDISVAENPGSAVVTVTGGGDVSGLDRLMLPYNNVTRPTGYLGALIVSKLWGENLLCSPPTNLNVTDISASAAKLNWSLPASSNGFKIRYRPVGTTDWNNTKATATATSKTLKNLFVGTKYEWQIRTTCSSDNSKWAKGPKFTTVLSLAADDDNISESNIKIQNKITAAPTVNNGNFLLKMQLPSKEQQTVLQLYNNVGKKVWEQNLGIMQGSINKNISLNGSVVKGTYILVVQRDDFRSSVRIVVSE